MAKEVKDQIDITKNRENESVFMNINTFKRREAILKLRAKVLQAERERIDGEETLSVSQARERLRERI